MSTTQGAPPRRLSPAWPADAGRPEAMVEQMRRLVRRNAARWKRLRILEAAGLALAVPLAYLWTLFLLDNTLYLRVVGRLLAAAGFLAVLVVLGIRLTCRLRALTLTEDEVALAIECQAPGGLHNRLINALQLARGAGGGDLAPAVIRENYDNHRHGAE